MLGAFSGLGPTARTGRTFRHSSTRSSSPAEPKHLRRAVLRPNRKHRAMANADDSHHFFCPCSGGARAAPATTSSSSFSSLLNADGFRFPAALARPCNHPGRPLVRLFSSSTPVSDRTFGFRGQGLRLPGQPPLEDSPSSREKEEEEGDDESESESGLDLGLLKKSRNQKKREARRAVKWGKDLAKFSPQQIRRILRAASLEKDVSDALMLVKASKDGDSSKLQALAGVETLAVEDDHEKEEDTEYEDGCNDYVDKANRWLDGLIYEDSSITNDVYSIYNVEFDRQELRKLVRQVHGIRESQPDEEEGREGDVALIKGKSALARFLRVLAKQSEAE